MRKQFSVKFIESKLKTKSEAKNGKLRYESDGQNINYILFVRLKQQQKYNWA